MRKIYYVPKGQDIEKYRDIWENHTSEIHNSISENIKEYIKDKDVAQWVLIPEFQYTEVPEMISDEDYFQYYFYDDFSYYEEDPQYKMEVYQLNLDVKDFIPFNQETHAMQWEKVLCKFYTDHIILPVGWYELRFVKGDEVIDKTEITVYKKHDDIADIISKTGQ
jgi:hypothetical protein